LQSAQFHYKAKRLPIKGTQIGRQFTRRQSNQRIIKRDDEQLEFKVDRFK